LLKIARKKKSESKNLEMVRCQCMVLQYVTNVVHEAMWPKMTSERFEQSDLMNGMAGRTILKEKQKPLSFQR
jgi:hypothetical protein